MALRPRNHAASPSGRGHFSQFAERPGSLYTEAPVQGTKPDGASPSGKAPDFDSGIRRFDPSRPSQPVRSLAVVAFSNYPDMSAG